MKTSEIFECFYGLRTVESIAMSEEDPCMSSYVPYIRGQTNILVFNFLRINYNFRDPAVLKVRIRRSSTDSCVTEHLCLFPSNEIVLLCANDLDPLAEPEIVKGIVQVSVFHPKIQLSAGEYRFFAFYVSENWGCAGIHSLPIRGLRSMGPHMGSRAVFPAGRDHFAVDPTRTQRIDRELTGGVLAKASSKERGIIGPSFFVSTDLSSRVSAVWHDSDVFQTVAKKADVQSICPIRQAFPVLGFPAMAPVAWIEQNQIGFLPRSIRFTARDSQGQLIEERVVTISQNEQVVNLAEVFFNTAECDVGYVVADFCTDVGEFQSPPLAYLHLWFRGKSGFGDQIHSMITPSYWTDPAAEPVSYRCRKFAPWSAHPNLEWIYAIINIGGIGRNKDETIRVRIFTDRNGEYVTNVQIPDERISFIRLEELVEPKFLFAVGAAVIQLESETSNFNAYWIFRDRATKIFGIDHFTGG